MKVTEKEDSIIIQNPENFDLSQTFDCGQCFRWELVNNKYYGIAYGKKLCVWQKNNEIIFEGINIKEFQKIWKDYFDLDTDYSKIGNEISKIDPLVDKAYNSYPGIRILKQEPWETLCSFIISQNNNIPRIKKIISRLCKLFGEKIEETQSDFTFPSPSVLSSLAESDLEPIKCGFRAKYILDAARKVSKEEINLNFISTLSTTEAENELVKINGVGPKIATCTLLYGFNRLEAFPLDVWTKRIMSTFFPGQSPTIFGKYAGIAQQYLYHYSRIHSVELFQNN